ncbi:MAG: LPP20 family lipoprotein [Selenomonadaceae bacterium]|nr:LPP20 family lipoprotein [Selenomonadaceae bacterium]
MKLFGALLMAVLLLASFPAEAALGADWNSQTITVTGSGVPPTGTRAAQARLLARRAAIADAYRQLAEIVEGVQVDAETTVEMAMLKSDTVNLRVEAVIKGAQIIDEAFSSDGAYEVTMQLPMFGATNSLAAAVLERHERIEPFPAPEPVRPNVSIDITVRGGYTGVVIDCRGFHVQPVMSPVIKNSHGTKIYGHKNIDPDYVIEYGMADYADSMSQASRAGSNPLVIRAERMDDFDSTPIISVADANKILSENDISGFLEKTAVVFLY